MARLCAHSASVCLSCLMCACASLCPQVARPTKEVRNKAGVKPTKPQRVVETITAEVSGLSTLHASLHCAHLSNA